MADHSHIEWTDATWNPVTGCSVVSPGCTNCYAMKLAGTRLRDHPSRAGLTTDSKAGPVWNGQVRLNEDWLTQPLQWKRPRRIFVCAHGDLFHESVPDAWIDRVFAVMALAPQHTFQVLTKRTTRMRAYIEGVTREGRRRLLEIYCTGELLAAMVGAPFDPDARDCPWPLPNVWLGVSAEDQARADERIPDLLATPAAVRFLSAEPMLGPIDLTAAWHAHDALDSECWGDCAWCAHGHPPLHNCRRGQQSHAELTRGRSGLDWVIVGGESGPGARPMHPDWARQIRNDCAAAGVPFFFKQWGQWRHVEVLEGSTVRHRYMAADGVADLELRRREEATGETDETAWYFAPMSKKAAGRLLDGVTHDAMPGVAA